MVGKGGQARLVVLPEPVAAAVAARGPGWTFPGRRGHAAADTVGRKVSAALGPGYTCHQLRHGFATAAYAAGGDLRAVQELLGHRSPTTTARYVAVPDQAMVAAAAGAARAYAAVV